MKASFTQDQELATLLIGERLSIELLDGSVINVLPAYNSTTDTGGAVTLEELDLAPKECESGSVSFLSRSARVHMCDCGFSRLRRSQLRWRRICTREL